MRFRGALRWLHLGSAGVSCISGLHLCVLNCPPQEECKEELNRYIQGFTGIPVTVMHKGSTDSSLLWLSDSPLLDQIPLPRVLEVEG